MSIKKKLVCLTLAAAVACSGLVGCYGSYALTGKVHQLGGSVGNKWIASLLNWFLAFPVGGFCMFADFLIFNTIEFWTGSNPIAMGDTFEGVDDSGNKIYAIKNSDGTLTVNAVDAAGNTNNYVWVRESNGISVYSARGELLASHIVE